MQVLLKYTGNLSNCFVIPNKFVIGFGMDINNLFRDLEDIYIMKEKDAQEKKEK